MIAIVIVNWNSGSYLGQCVNSIAQHHHECVAKVVIVDNASTDNSLEFLKFTELLPFALELVSNETNVGFAAACNLGASKTSSEYILFLNPDTRISDRSLVVPLAFMRDPAHSRVGICGIQLIDERGRVARSCARFPTPLRFACQVIGWNKLPGLRSSGMHMAGWTHRSSRRVDHVIGAFFLVRCGVFRELGGFDSKFFVYLEDLDFSYRAHAQKWSSWYLASASAFHAGGGSSRNVKARRLFYSLKSRLLYAAKHFSLLGFGLTFLLTLLVEPVARILFCVLHLAWSDVRNTTVAYRLLITEIPLLFASARKS